MMALLNLFLGKGNVQCDRERKKERVRMCSAGNKEIRK